MSNEGSKKRDAPQPSERQADEDPLTDLHPREPARGAGGAEAASPSAPAERPQRGNGSATMAGVNEAAGEAASVTEGGADAGADGGTGSGTEGGTEGGTQGGAEGNGGQEGGQAEADSAEPTPEAALEAMRGELRQQQERYLRLHAEFENTKKRMQKEHGESLRYALTPVVTEVAAVMDNLERAVEHARKEQGEAVAALLAGIEMVVQQMQEALGRFGVTRIAAAGKPFDPAMHEAMTVVETDDVPENQVLEEFQAGYLLHDRVVRPARVSVSKRATGADAPTEPGGG